MPSSCCFGLNDKIQVEMKSVLPNRATRGGDALLPRRTTRRFYRRARVGPASPPPPVKWTAACLIGKAFGRDRRWIDHDAIPFCNHRRLLHWRRY